ncbi:hypothetical protein AMJ86_00735 [bacterium SM23_57]|nr:MAG: hypothetical protein AMJ86_00735 [bacterium SM23_57]
MNKYDKLEKIQQAQDMLNEVISILDEIIPENSYYDAYLLTKLKIYCSDDHGYLTNDPNLDKLLEDIDGEIIDY